MLLKIEKGYCIFTEGNTRNLKSFKIIGNIDYRYEEYMKNIFLNQSYADIMKQCVEKSKKICELGKYSLYEYRTTSKPEVVLRNQYVLDADKVGKLKLRYKKNGDMFSPNGIDGTQKIVKCMQSLRIDSADRKTWPLLADENNIYWIPFCRGSREARVTDKTTDFLVVTLIK